MLARRYQTASKSEVTTETWALSAEPRKMLDVCNWAHLFVSGLGSYQILPSPHIRRWTEGYWSSIHHGVSE